MAVTMKMIAEKANVSIGTVDRALNNKTGISKKTKAKILRISEELGYETNIVAKALSYKKKPIKIGIIILGEKKPDIFDDIYRGILEGKKKYDGFGIKITVMKMKTLKLEEQLECIDKLEKENINGLAICPLDDKNIRNKLNLLSEKGIKVVTFNTDILDIDKLCFVGQNLYKSGRVAAQLMLKMLPDKGEVALIGGVPQIKSIRDRIQGFKSLISKDSSINICTIRENIKNEEDAYKETKDILNKFPYIHGFCITVSYVSGIIKALKEEGKKVKIVCFDENKKNNKLLKEEEIDFVITQEPFMQGYLPIEILFEYFFKDKEPDNIMKYTKLEIKTKENIDE